MGDRSRARIEVTGVVQGVGFRPFVSRTAATAGLGGSVRNVGGIVEVTFEGNKKNVTEVIENIRNDHPPLASVENVDVTWTEPVGAEDFEIRESEAEAKSTSVVPVPPDTGICDACLADVRNPDSSYYEYWATACVDCGPRFSVVSDVPYDRGRTSMADFPMCDGCRERYEDPTDRRYHAQAVACPDCGPELRYEVEGDPRRIGRTALKLAAEALADYGIVAVKGTSGIHLVCDATDPSVVEELRERTNRPAKPFACMAPSVEAVESFARVGDVESEAFTDIRRPIVLLEKEQDEAWLDAVAPGLATVGVMLPYAGLHHLLFDHVEGPLVMTSANLPGQPMCTNAESVWAHLGGVVDGALVHNRKIVARCDDSVVRVVDGDRRFIRRSRGWTPTVLPNPAAPEAGPAPAVLALGPERDATVALAAEEGIVPSMHLGDIDGPDTMEFHREVVAHLRDLTGIDPDVVVCDMHPDFLTTAEADRYTEEGLAGPVAVQHHHAHATGLCAEHGVDRAIVVTADGTGYGPDGTVWGGEVLDVTYGEFEHVGGLAQFPLPGGEAAVEYPARALAGLLDDEDRVVERLVETGAVESPAKADVICQQADKGVNAPTTTSAGRFLDAVSALVGVCDRRRYEGEPAQKLEAVAEDGTVHDLELPFETHEGGRVLDMQVLATDLKELANSALAADVAATAQDALARGLATIAVDAATAREVDAVGFTGGVAYNDAISRRMRECVEEAGHTFLAPEAVPPGDGGIAYGQAIVATARRTEE